MAYDLESVQWMEKIENNLTYLFYFLQHLSVSVWKGPRGPLPVLRFLGQWRSFEACCKEIGGFTNLSGDDTFYNISFVKEDISTDHWVEKKGSTSPWENNNVSVIPHPDREFSKDF